MEYCCDLMKHHCEMDCGEHRDSECPDKVMKRYSEGYGLLVHDGGASLYTIEYCPWCGSKLSV